MKINTPNRVMQHILKDTKDTYIKVSPATLPFVTMVKRGVQYIVYPSSEPISTENRYVTESFQDAFSAAKQLNEVEKNKNKI